MTPTSFPPKLAAALCKVSADIKQLGKSETNKYQGYDFVSVDKFYLHVGHAMADNGVHCIPDCLSSEVLPGNVKYDRDGKERRGSPLLKEKWAFTILHQSGEMAGPFHRFVTVPAEGAQAHGSSESYAQKQFLRGLFRVPTGDKDDADWQDKIEHPAPPKKTAKAPPKKSPPKKPAAKKSADGGDPVSALLSTCQSEKAVVNLLEKWLSKKPVSADTAQAWYKTITEMEKRCNELECEPELLVNTFNTINTFLEAEEVF